MNENKTRESQERIYRDLYEKHTDTPKAVSSESWEHKFLRYKNICKIFYDDEEWVTDSGGRISLHDIGMGVADLYAYIKNQFGDKKICYSGSDILEEFVMCAKRRYPEFDFYHRDIAEATFDDKYDYLVMSGVFHQRQDIIIKDWENFSQRIIKNAFSMCKKGVAFNFISPFVDFYQTQVYYCNFPKLLNFINDNLSRFFEIKHNYALYEFTVCVYQEAYIKTKHHQPEFQKYFKI